MKKTIHGKHGGSVKFLLPCNDLISSNDDWLSIKGHLTTKDFDVLLGTLSNYKSVVIKFGTVKNMLDEYTMGKLLFNHHVPNFIKFLCNFTCDDTVQEVRTRNFDLDSFICKAPGDNIGFILMPYYSLGSLQNYLWNRSNFLLLKNVLHQLVFGILYAFETCSFVHGDLHVGNVLLRATKKKELSYGTRHLSVNGMYAIIMDFGRSYIAPGAYIDVYRNIDRLLSLIANMEQSDLALECNRKPIKYFIETNKPIDDEVYTKLYQIIDSIEIRYVISELPKINFRL